MIDTFNAVLPIFLLIVTGFFLKRRVCKDDVFWRTAESLTYYVFFPCLLVLKVGGADFESINTYSTVIAIVIAVTVVVGLLAFALKRVMDLPDDLFTSVFQGSTRYNSYVFLGLAMSVYGDKGVAIAGVFLAYMIIFTNVLSVAVLNYYGHGSRKSMGSIALALFKNPLILGSLVGIVFNFTGVKISGPIEVYMHYLADAASPLSLLAVGSGLVLSFNRKKSWAVGSSTVLKLLVMPIATFALIRSFGFSGLPAQIGLLYACVPTAGNSYILARQMGGDTEAMASIITATTLGSTLSALIFIGLL